MYRLTAIALLASFVFVTAVHAQSPAAPNPLIGAWRITEIAEANRPPIAEPQPGPALRIQVRAPRRAAG